MKKLLLAGTALVGFAVLATPAQADLTLNLSGHFSGYGVYIDEDAEIAGQRDFEFRKNSEIHFTGETTLDNGLTVGVHVEQEVENATQNNESYVYFSGGWGRTNFGNEDGVAYLLQVAAPSADSNVDGLRNTIASYQSNVVLDYDHADFGNQATDDPDAAATDRFSYLSPKFNGFQAGVSYTPNAAVNTGIAANGAAGMEDLWEVAARWDGQFEGVGVSFGAGYSTSDNSVAAGPEAETYNVGLNLAWNAFSFGAAYVSQEETQGTLADSSTWVVGAGWDNGPYHLGASYLARDDDALVWGAGSTQLDSNKATVGASYSFGPGVTFRGAAAWGEAPLGAGAAAVETDFSQFTLGTDIQF